MIRTGVGFAIVNEYGASRGKAAVWGPPPVCNRPA